jgi:phosphate transport system substrate-binding protein
MFTLKTAQVLAIGIVTAATSVGMAAPQDLESLQGSVKVDGSSTVYPITAAVAEEFSKAASRVRVTVGISGTGGGFKRFSVGDTDISNASRPIKAKEYAQAKENGVEFIEIPVAYDGLSIVVNKDNYWVDKLAVEDLQKIFLDGTTVDSWNDLNPEWPDIAIKVYAPGTDSGTFDYFKEVVAGKNNSIRSDMSVSEDDNVLIRGVVGDQGGIGFFGCAYYFENKDKLKIVPIVNPATMKAVTPNPETIESGEYAPFSRPLFIYVNAKSVTRPEVKAFVKFYLEEGPALAEEVGYVKLPRNVYRTAQRNFEKIHTGTCFLDEKMEPKHGALPTLYK